MDIEQYLHNQFETYPRIFRDVSEYLPKKEIRESIMTTRDTLPCLSCEHNMVLKSVETRKGLRYHYICSHCDGKSGELQNSPAIAYWSFQAAKKVASYQRPPLVNEIMLDGRYTKWLESAPAKRADSAALWVAGLKWMKWVWSQHRKTQDYKSLSTQDQLYIDAIGSCIDVLRKEAASFSASVGVDVTNEESVELLVFADKSIKKERLDAFPRYKEKLSPMLRKVLKDVFLAP